MEDKNKGVLNIDAENELMELPMIPLRGLSLFPNMVLHFDIGREKSINALEKAMVVDQHIFLVSQKDDSTDLPTMDDFYHIGTIAKIKQMLKLPSDSIRVLVEGVCKGRLEEMLFEVPYFKCLVRKVEDVEYPLDDAEAEQGPACGHPQGAMVSFCEELQPDRPAHVRRRSGQGAV